MEAVQVPAAQMARGGVPPQCSDGSDPGQLLSQPPASQRWG